MTFLTSIVHADELDGSSTSSGQIGFEVASGTPGPFYTNTPAVPTLSGTNKPNLGRKKGSEAGTETHRVSFADQASAGRTSSTSGSYDGPVIASGTYGPFFTDTPALPTLSATDSLTLSSQERIDVASGTYSPFYRDTPTLQRTRSTGDGASNTITRVGSGGVAATGAAFTSTRSSSGQ